MRHTVQLNVRSNVHLHRARPRPRSAFAAGPVLQVSISRAPGLNEFGEEDLDLPLGRLRRVAAMHDILGHLQGIVTPDGPRRGLHRVGGSGERTERLDGPLALRYDRDQRAGGDEIDKFPEEGLFRVLSIVRVRGLDVDCAQLQRDHLQAFALNSGNDVTDDAALDTVWLDEDKGAL